MSRLFAIAGILASLALAACGGHPLYYYVHDPPGEVLCHDVEEFGGLWLVVDPSGEAVL
jgi:hypothetical protein